MDSPAAPYAGKPVQCGQDAGDNESDSTVTLSQPAEQPPRGTPLPAETATFFSPNQTSGDAEDVAKRYAGRMASLRRCLAKGNVVFLIACFLGVVLGFGLGLGLRPFNLDPAAEAWVGKYRVDVRACSALVVITMAAANLFASCLSGCMIYE